MVKSSSSTNHSPRQDFRVQRHPKAKVNSKILRVGRLESVADSALGDFGSIDLSVELS